MNFIKKVVAAIVIMALVTIAIALFLTSDITKTADKFFDAVKSNNYDEAYSLLSTDFKKDTSKRQLKAYLEKHALNQAKSTSWNSRSIKGNRAKVTGTLSTESGMSIPVMVTFAKGTEWKINAIRKLLAGVRDTEQIPSQEEQRKLIGETMHLFALSVKEHSMEKIYNHLSNTWKRQWTMDQFEKSFSPFYTFGSELMVVDRITPKFPENATINKDDLLVIKGIYPTHPKQLFFTHKYIYEGLGWKLLGLKVEVK